MPRLSARPVLLLALPLAACPGDAPDPATTGATASEATSTGGTTREPTTGAATTPETTQGPTSSTGATSETSAATTTGATEPSSTTGVDPTTGDPTGDTTVGTSGDPTTTGDPTTDATTTDAATTTGGGLCGDGVVDPGEACDDGDAEDGDGCEATCAWTPCAFLWQRTYPEPGVIRFGHAVAAAPSGDLAIAATLQPAQSDSRLIALKLDPDGDPLWTTTAFDLRSEANGVVITGDGGIIAIGTEYDYLASDLTRRFTADGDLGWLAYKVLPTSSFGYDVALTGDGGLILAGYRSVNIPSTPWLARVDVATGATEWTSLGQVAGAEEAQHLAVAVGPDGDLYTTGNARINGSLRLLVRRFDAAGAEKWAANVASPVGFARGWDVQVHPGGVAVVGEFFYGDAGKTGGDLWVGLFDGDGGLLWSDLHDGAPGKSYDRANGVAVDAKGHVHAVGRVQPGLYNAIYRKYAADGDLLCSEVVDATPEWHTIFHAVTIAPGGFPVVTGYTEKMIYVAKLTP